MDQFEARAWLEYALRSKPERIAHSNEVARGMSGSVEQINSLLLSDEDPLDTELAVSAGLLHDIGYSPELAITKFHPVDGYIYLVEKGIPILGELIVGHTSAVEEGASRGFCIIPSQNIVAKLLTYWDAQTGPSGQRLSYPERLQDIRKRYGLEDLVTLANLNSRSRIEEIIREVESVLSGERRLSSCERSMEFLNGHLLNIRTSQAVRDTNATQ